MGPSSLRRWPTGSGTPSSSRHPSQYPCAFTAYSPGESEDAIVSRTRERSEKQASAWHEHLMAAIIQETVQAYVDAVAQATTTADQGRALENLICYVFTQVPGISITKRNAMNAFQTEEIDVALWNDGDPNGLF